MNLTSAAHAVDAAMVAASSAGAALPIGAGAGAVDVREKSASPVCAS
jgi:hypothetical protein